MYIPAKYNGIKITLWYVAFHRIVDKVLTLLGYFIGFIGNLLETLQDNISLVTSSTVKQCKNAWRLEGRMIHCPEMLPNKVPTMARNMPGQWRPQYILS